jgi:hypothetical protein
MPPRRGLVGWWPVGYKDVAPSGAWRRRNLIKQKHQQTKFMNTNQKILTIVALLAFFVSICNASWEVISSDAYGTYYPKMVQTSPVWQQPSSQQHIGSYIHSDSHLLWSPLIVIWIAIGVVYVGLFFLLKNTPSILVLLNNSSKKTGN